MTGSSESKLSRLAVIRLFTRFLIEPVLIYEGRSIISYKTAPFH